jgi:hypothetical protein
MGKNCWDKMPYKIYIYTEKINTCHYCFLNKFRHPCSKCDNRKYYKMKLTLVNSLVSLKTFYDMGRLPLHLGGDYGRVTWTALDGSKWIDFRTWIDYRQYVRKRDKGKCCMCGKNVYGETFVCDHIIPLFKGGKDWWEDPEMTNFQTLCEACNKIKTKRDMSKPKLIRQKLNLNVVQYAGFVFENIVERDHCLDEYSKPYMS